MARIRRPRWLRAKRYEEFPNIKFVSPCTKWTMNIMLLIVFLASVVASVLILITVISDGMVIVKNSNSIMYDAKDSSGVVTRVVLVPQFQVDVGTLRFCTSGKCFQRSDRNLLPIFPFNNNSQLVSPYSVLDQFPPAVASAFDNVTRESLQFGYASSTYCGGSSKKVTSLALLSFSAAVIGLAFSVFLIGSSGVLLVYVTQYDPVSDPHWEPELDTPPTKEQRTRVKKLLKRNQTNQRARLSLRHVIVVMGAIAFVFLIIALVSEQFQLRTTLHCGKSFCSSYMHGMNTLLDTINAKGSTQVACQYGFGYICLYVGAMAAVVAFACSIVFQVCDIFFVVDELGMERCARLGLLVDDILVADPPKPGGAAVKVADTANRDGLMKGTSMVPDRVSFEAPSPTVTGYEVESNDGKPGALLRGLSWEARKGGPANPLVQFQEDERKERHGIIREEAFEFLLGIRLLRRKLWRNERLLIVHQWSLNWCIGPQMDFYLEETFRRQEILTTYRSALRMVIIGMESKASSPEEAYDIQMSAKNIDPLEKWLALASLDRIAAMQQPDEDDNEALLDSERIDREDDVSNDDVDVDELFQTAHWIAMTERPVQSTTTLHNPRDAVDGHMRRCDSEHDEEGSLVEVSSLSSNSTAYGADDPGESVGPNALAETVVPHQVTSSGDDAMNTRGGVGNNTFFQMSYEELLRKAQRPTCYSTRLHYRKAEQARAISSIKQWKKKMELMERSTSSRTVGTEEEDEGEMGYSLPLSTAMGTATNGSEAHATSVDQIRQHLADTSDLDENMNEYTIPTLQNNWRQRTTPLNTMQLPTLSKKTGSAQRMDVTPPKTKSAPANRRSKVTQGYPGN